MLYAWLSNGNKEKRKREMPRDGIAIGTYLKVHVCMYVHVTLGKVGILVSLYLCTYFVSTLLSMLFLLYTLGNKGNSVLSEEWEKEAGG